MVRKLAPQAPLRRRSPRVLVAVLVIVLLVLLVLGGDRLASVGKGLGAGARAYKKAVRPPEDPPPEPLLRRVIVVTAEPLPDDAPKTSNPSAKPREGS